MRRIVGITVIALALAGCGGGDEGAADGLSGSVQVDGSSTVAPLATLAAERFGRENDGVRVTVGTSGTGGGFERFCRGETDISNASRPIKDEEKQACEADGVDYVELHVANDALSVVVNSQNDWASCLTVEQLKKIWEPGSKVDSWRDVDPKFPDEELALAGPGTDSGTFDYFTDEIVGEEGASRTDYQASENDNVVVQAVSGEQGGLGYFGLSYLKENEGRIKGVAIDGGDGCVEPSIETVQDGSYKPLGRPLLMYVKREALGRPEVDAFLAYLLDNNAELAETALFVPLTDEQLTESRAALKG